MLRIDLLPNYVKQRRVIKQMITGFVVAAIACVALPLVFYFYNVNELKNQTALANAAVEGKAKTDASKALAVSTLAQVDPIKAKIDFVAAALAYPGHWVQFYQTLANVTPLNSLIYSGTVLGAGTGAAGGYPGSGGAAATAAVAGPTSATIKAYSPSVATVGRYLQAMYREPDFTTVAVDKVPGYPDNVRNLYYYGKTLVFADDATSTGGSGGSGYPGGGGGYPGGGGGRSSSYPGSSAGGRPGGYPTGGGGNGQGTGANGPTDYTPTNLGPNAPGNIPPGVGPPPPELTGGVSNTGGNGPGGGGYPGGGQRPGLQQGGQQTAQQNGTGGVGATPIIYGEVFDRVAGSNISPFATPEIRQSILRARLRRVVKKTVPRGFELTVTATLKDETTKLLTQPALPGSAPAAGTGTPGGFPGGPGGGRGGYPGGPPPPPGARPTG